MPALIKLASLKLAALKIIALRLAALRLVKWSLLLTFVFSPNSVFANHQNGRVVRDVEPVSSRNLIVSPYFGGGVGFGGEEVGAFFDGFGNTETVRAGGGGLIEGGLLYTFLPSTGLRLTIGYQSDGASRFNGSSTFERLRFDLAFIRAFGRNELGIGVTGHTLVTFRCDIRSVCGFDNDFDNAVGITLEYAYNFGRRFSPIRHRSRAVGSLAGLRLGVRFTGIEYDSRDDDILDSDEFDGNTLTGFIGVSF